MLVFRPDAFPGSENLTRPVHQHECRRGPDAGARRHHVRPVVREAEAVAVLRVERDVAARRRHDDLGAAVEVCDQAAQVGLRALARSAGGLGENHQGMRRPVVPFGGRVDGLARTVGRLGRAPIG